MNADPKSLVLVVDDDARALELMHADLRHAGYRVQGAADGATALDLLTADPPLLILADLLMPGMTGLELCARVRSNAAWSGMKFVLLTGMDDDETRREALGAGADEVIIKPFDRADLLARLSRLLQP